MFISKAAFHIEFKSTGMNQLILPQLKFNQKYNRLFFSFISRKRDQDFSV